MPDRLLGPRRQTRRDGGSTLVTAWNPSRPRDRDLALSEY